MMTPPGLTCDRAAELLSDHCEEALDAVLTREVDDHLASCADCRDLRASLAEVIDLLRTSVDVAPASDLAERAANAALAAGRAPRPRVALGRLRHGLATMVPRPSTWTVPLRVQALAAALAVVLSGALVVTALSADRGGWATRLPRVTERVSNATVYIAERKDRLVEDFRLLRVVVATAFEGRIDRVNDRVEDYRRLLERRRKDEKAKDGKKGQASLGTPLLAVATRPVLPGNI